jgi:hypothetical protein
MIVSTERHVMNSSKLVKSMITVKYIMHSHVFTIRCLISIVNNPCILGVMNDTADDLPHFSTIYNTLWK